jgi:hypothetical protein
MLAVPRWGVFDIRKAFLTTSTTSRNSHSFSERIYNIAESIRVIEREIGGPSMMRHVRRLGSKGPRGLDAIGSYSDGLVIISTILRLDRDMTIW